MYIKQKIIRIVADLLLYLKKNDISSANIKFLVFTGTGGKTTSKDAVFEAISLSGSPVQKSLHGYNNELGIIKTILNIQALSLSSPRSWVQIYKEKITINTFVCIELGADFYIDTKWFLNKFTPYAVFISSSLGESWSRDVNNVNADRVSLLKSVPASGCIFYNADCKQTSSLVSMSKSSAKLIPYSTKNKLFKGGTYIKSQSQNITQLPISSVTSTVDEVCISSNNNDYTISSKSPFLEPKLYAVLSAYSFMRECFPEDIIKLSKHFSGYEYSKDRLQFYTSKNDCTILVDSYKATPLCVLWIIKIAKQIKAHKKILVLSELRPLKYNINNYYKTIALEAKFFDYVYFVGPDKIFEILHSHNSRVQKISIDNYSEVADCLHRLTTKGDLVVIKGSFVYKLNSLKDLLT